MKIFLIPISVLGFVKIYLSKMQRIVGSLVVSPRAGEIIHELILAIKNKEKISKIANLMHIYPIYSIIVQQAAMKKTEKSLLEGILGKIIRATAKIICFSNNQVYRIKQCVNHRTLGLLAFIIIV